MCAEHKLVAVSLEERIACLGLKICFYIALFSLQVHLLSGSIDNCNFMLINVLQIQTLTLIAYLASFRMTLRLVVKCKYAYRRLLMN